MSIAWTKKGLAQLHPRRGGPKETLKPVKFDLDKALGALVARFQQLDPWSKFEAGHAHCEADCLRLMKAVQHKLTEGLSQARQGPLDLELEAAMAAMHYTTPDETIAYWAHLESPAFAVAATVKSWSFNLKHGYAKGAGEYRTLSRREVPTHEAFDSWLSELYSLKALRRCLALAQEPPYQEAVQTATPLFEEAPPALQCALAYVFPTEPAWASRCVANALTTEHPPAYSWCLLSCLLSPQEAVALVQRSGARNSAFKKYMSAYAFAVSLVDVLGEEAIQPLAWLLGHAKLADDQRQTVLALTQIASPQAARTLLPLLTDLKLRPLLLDYYKAHPDLGRPVLEEASAGKGKLAEEAAGLARLIY